MNAVIRMSAGKPVLPEVTKAEMARRLELFEIALREDRIAELSAQLKALQALQVARLELTENSLLVFKKVPTDDVVKAFQHEISKRGLHNVTAILGTDVASMTESERHTLRQQLAGDVIAEKVELYQVVQQQNDYITELENAGNVLAADRDALRAECQQWQDKATVLAGNIAKLQNDKNALQAEIKRLNALEPDRAKQRIKRLQDDKTAMKTAIDELRGQNQRLKQDNRDKAKAITQLDIALDKACDDINAKNAIAPLEQINLGALGLWEIFGTPDTDRYNVLDVKNNVSIGVRIENGAIIQPEIRALPKNLLKMLLARASRYAAQEAAIANIQKPLS